VAGSGSEEALGGKLGRDLGEGVRGVEKGCAAEVEVAAGGLVGRGLGVVVLRCRA